jgi:hypothetical protein
MPGSRSSKIKVGTSGIRELSKRIRQAGRHAENEPFDRKLVVGALDLVIGGRSLHALLKCGYSNDVSTRS